MRRRPIPRKAPRNGRRDYPEPLQCRTPTHRKDSHPGSGVAVLISDARGHRFRRGGVFARTPDPERSHPHSAMVRVNQTSLV